MAFSFFGTPVRQWTKGAASPVSEADIAVKAAALDKIEAEAKSKLVEAKHAELDDRFKAFARSDSREKAQRILAGVSQPADGGIKAIG